MRFQVLNRTRAEVIQIAVMLELTFWSCVGDSCCGCLYWRSVFVLAASVICGVCLDVAVRNFRIGGGCVVNHPFPALGNKFFCGNYVESLQM